MPIGHDVLISVDRKIKPYFYRFLISYIGDNYPKEYLKDTSYKNGIRIIKKNCSIDVSKGKIKKWAQTRLYFAKHTIVMDEDVSASIFDAILKSLYSIPGRNEYINNVLANQFEIIKKPTEEFTRRLTILEDIYREILSDASNNDASASFCCALRNIEELYN